jgi:hypothetical protein
MKCEMCNYHEKPDNLQKIVLQAETCQLRLCRKAKVVWRDGQMTLTMTPQDNETVFGVEIKDVPPAPVPPISIPRHLKSNTIVEDLSLSANVKDEDTDEQRQ